jgi:hypothetical protein
MCNLKWARDILIPQHNWREFFTQQNLPFLVWSWKFHLAKIPLIFCLDCLNLKKSSLVDVSTISLYSDLLHPEGPKCIHIIYQNIGNIFWNNYIQWSFKNQISFYVFNYLVHLLQRRFDLFFCPFNARTIFMLIWCYFVQSCQQKGIFSHPLNRNLKLYENKIIYKVDNEYLVRFPNIKLCNLHNQ